MNASSELSLWLSLAASSAEEGKRLQPSQQKGFAMSTDIVYRLGCNSTFHALTALMLCCRIQASSAEGDRGSPSKPAEGVRWASCKACTLWGGVCAAVQC